jgi:RNA polymerase sigma-70 factor (ECF subfamily)
MSKHGARLRQYAFSLTQNDDDADDLYQDSVLKIYLNLNQYKVDKSFTNWAMRVIQNTFRDDKRKKSVRTQTTTFEDLNNKMGYEVDFADPTADTESNLMLDLINDMNSKQIRNMIKELNPSHRVALSLLTYGTENPLDYKNSDPEGMHFTDISEKLKIPVGTVRSRIFRANRELEKKTFNPII